MRPKARFVNGVWIVWDGVTFANGFSQHPSLEIAYNYYLELLLIVAYQQQWFKTSVIGHYGRAFRISREDLINETK